ncbi:hypothetical protein L3Q82_021807 [Scortum barcoo]|uniref:Uncharacterized protein n=1 Tax=Scortum barcoo TaxID=214431 RepID=A0ACB8X6I4_9TELE|nr:hypothetical protein L3Q82_021807 [Scortum barcoo]
MSHRKEAPGEDPGHAGETMSLGWPGNASGILPGIAGGSVWGEGSLGISAQTAVLCDPVTDKRRKMDGWMESIKHSNLEQCNLSRWSARQAALQRSGDEECDNKEVEDKETWIKCCAPTSRVEPSHYVHWDGQTPPGS